MEDYFAGNPDFIRLYEDLSERYDTPVRRAFLNLRKECSALLRILP